MRAWEVARRGPIDSHPLAWVERDPPEPRACEIAVRVTACGVCRTDLHIVEGDLPLRRPRVVPGHEVVGTVEALGPGATRFEPGRRIGIPWLRHTCGRCRFCRRDAENLCVSPAFTGYDADGGYAERAVVHEDYAYDLPEALDDERAAPLLCAGIIGYRALRRSRLPPGGRLGIFGFGASAHLAAQVAVAEGARVHVVTRSERARQLALRLGAQSATGSVAGLPERLDAGIVFAPVGDVVPPALEALEPGATLVIAGIHMSALPSLHYARHLFGERALTSVTANTRADGEEFIALAARLAVAVTTVPYALDRADDALSDLAHGRLTGAAVLLPDH